MPLFSSPISNTKGIVQTSNWNIGALPRLMVVVAAAFGFPRKQVGPESFSAGHLDITSTFLAAFKPQFPGKTNNIQPAKHWSFKRSEAIDRNCPALLQGIHHTIANALSQPDTLKRRQC